MVGWEEGVPRVAGGPSVAGPAGDGAGVWFPAPAGSGAPTGGRWVRWRAMRVSVAAWTVGLRSSADLRREARPGRILGRWSRDAATPLTIPGGSPIPGASLRIAGGTGGRGRQPHGLAPRRLTPAWVLEGERCTDRRRRGALGVGGDLCALVPGAPHQRRGQRTLCCRNIMVRQRVVRCPVPSTTGHVNAQPRYRESSEYTDRPHLHGCSVLPDLDRRPQLGTPVQDGWGRVPGRVLRLM